MISARARGGLGEDFAVAKLEEEGYTILARNYHYSHAEIDIIAQRGETIAFVEVKMRSKNALASPAAYVSRGQQRRIVLAAVAYLQSRGIYNTGEFQPRFDIFELATESAGSPKITRFEHITGAYDAGGLDVFL